MAKIIDKLWNWGHLEGSHDKCVGCECHMTPEQFGKEYGINKSFIVSYFGNIQPPFDGLAKSMSSLDEIKWSVLGDAGTPLPEHELGNAPDVIAAAKEVNNITGAVVDDFFSPERLERFTPKVLCKIKNSLNEQNLDFWCVLYNHQLDIIDDYINCFDGITFWIWHQQELLEMESAVRQILKKADGKPVMLGIYLWDYSGKRPMDTKLFQKQLNYYIELLQAGSIEGIIFCSSAIGDADLETNKILKEYIDKYGQREVK